MLKYSKDNPRITVRFIDSKTEEELFSVEKNWTNIGEIYTSHFLSSLLQLHFKDMKKTPEKIMVMIAEEFTLIEK